MKIGVITFFQSEDNYGQILQGYALQKVLKKEGHNPYIIRYCFHRHSSLEKKKHEDSASDLPLESNTSCDIDRQFSTFRRKYFDFSPNYYDTLQQLRDNPPISDCYIAGSDQIWAQDVVWRNNRSFFLDFGSKDTLRVAYAPCFAFTEYPKESCQKVKKLLQEFDALSVREVSGSKICEQLGFENVPVVQDPTLLLLDTEYPCHKERLVEGDYCFAYHVNISSPHEMKWEFFSSFNKAHSIPTIATFANPEKDKDMRMLEDAEYLYPTIEEWLSLIRHAKYVATTSFHGIVFSILMHRPFVALLRKESKYAGNDRIITLLTKLGLERFMVSYQQQPDVEILLEQNIDWEDVDRRIALLKEDSLLYLRRALSIKKKKKSVAHKVLSHDCVGCGACAQKCPTQCITMQPDEEGFLRPSINSTKCSECGICSDTCPSLHALPPRTPLATFASNSNNKEELECSSSGGVFSILSRNVIAHGGCVFGAAFDKNWNVEHRIANTEDDICYLRGSKYVQSNTKDTFVQVQQQLTKGRLVMFSGTPCQIAALQKFLGKSYPNLITVDVVCHGIPSPAVWQTYLNSVYLSREEEITDVNFREKKDGWANYHVCVETKKQGEWQVVCHREHHSSNPYMQVFLYDLISRPSCYNCKFKSGRSGSDITLGDFWNVHHVIEGFNDDRGTSLLLINTPKGMRFSKDITNASTSKAVNFEEAIQYNPAWAISYPVPPARRNFFNDLFRHNIPFPQIASNYSTIQTSSKDIKISFITINHNNADALRVTAHSLESQVYQGWEWVVIDSNSTDNSSEVLREYSNYITHCGQALDRMEAINKAIAHCTGEYVLLLEPGNILNDANGVQRALEYIKDEECYITNIVKASSTFTSSNYGATLIRTRILRDYVFDSISTSNNIEHIFSEHIHHDQWNDASTTTVHPISASRYMTQKSNEIEPMLQRIEQLQTENARITRKNKKHLKYCRFLAITATVLLVTLLILIIKTYM